MLEEIPSNEVVSSQPINYMSDHPVFKESNYSTTVRPVFNASSTSYNGISLNDCLEPGPSLNPVLVILLICFRKWKVALTAAITILYISVQPGD